MVRRRRKVGLKYKNLQVMLESLRLAYRERDKTKVSYRVELPLFGIRIRLEGYQPGSEEDVGWDVLTVSVDNLKDRPQEILKPLMWLLISKGYLAYIRESERGANGRIFRSIIVDAGWGQKIMERRIELCGNEPKNSFIRMRMEEFLKVAMPRIIAHYPGFFDYLF